MGEKPERRDEEHRRSDGRQEGRARPHEGADSTAEDADATGSTESPEGARDQGTPEAADAAAAADPPTAAAWDDLVLDERFIRDAEVNEPAARTRMLQERWRERPPEPQPWRADEPPAGWFFSKGRRKARKRKRKKGE